MKTVGRSNS